MLATLKPLLQSISEEPNISQLGSSSRGATGNQNKPNPVSILLCHIHHSFVQGATITSFDKLFIECMELIHCRGCQWQITGERGLEEACLTSPTLVSYTPFFTCSILSGQFASTCFILAGQFASTCFRKNLQDCNRH